MCVYVGHSASQGHRMTLPHLTLIRFKQKQASTEGHKEGESKGHERDQHICQSHTGWLFVSQ